jgi:hypothetical protein
MDELEGTAEQKFMIMLKERMDKLEDKIASLEEKFKEHEDSDGNHSASRFHFFNISYKPVEQSETSECLKKHMLDIIFHNRDIYEPCFATWKFVADEDDTSIKILIVTTDPVSSSKLTGSITHDEIEVISQDRLDYGMLRSLFFYDGVKCLVNYGEDAPMFYQQDGMKKKVEYWWRYIPEVVTGAINNVILTRDPFTSSDNYSASDMVQKYIHKCIYRDGDFAELLNIYRL